MTETSQSQSPTSVLQKMTQLGDEKNQMLYTVKSIFPLDLFPTVITIERTKVNIIKQLFFSSAQTQSILVDEIATVEITTSLFFSALRIHNKVPNRAPYNIPNLANNEAAHAQRIIQGLMVSSDQKVDISKVPIEELLPQLEKIGASHATLA
jgi:hypothetical protein